VLGKLRAAVGKAHLLTSKKFKQFRELCHRNLVSVICHCSFTILQSLWQVSKLLISVFDVCLISSQHASYSVLCTWLLCILQIHVCVCCVHLFWHYHFQFALLGVYVASRSQHSPRTARTRLYIQSSIFISHTLCFSHCEIVDIG